MKKCHYYVFQWVEISSLYQIIHLRGVEYMLQSKKDVSLKLCFTHIFGQEGGVNMNKCRKLTF